jgi:hypothetical protein
MRFAFISITPGWPWAGSEELGSQAATELKRTGHDVQVAVMYWPQLSDKATLLAQHGIKLETQAGPAWRMWNRLSFSSGRSCGRLKKFNSDLVGISQGHNQGGLRENLPGGDDT